MQYLGKVSPGPIGFVPKTYANLGTHPKIPWIRALS